MYHEMYFHIFNAVTDALAAMEQLNFGQAADLLKQAQQDAEERYMTGNEGHSSADSGAALSEAGSAERGAEAVP